MLAYALTTARNVDEKPFILYFTLVAFPFGWFLLWIFVAAIGWWLEIAEPPSSDEEPGRKSRD